MPHNKERRVNENHSRSGVIRVQGIVNPNQAYVHLPTKMREKGGDVPDLVVEKMSKQPNVMDPTMEMVDTMVWEWKWPDLEEDVGEELVGDQI